MYTVICDECNKNEVEVFLEPEGLDEDEVEEYIKENEVHVPVCSSCGSESSFDEDGNRIFD